MSLLPYVIAFLMVLTAITYSRMESMKTLVPSSIAFREYAKSHEKFAQVESWEEVYRNNPVRENENTKKENSCKGGAKLFLKPIFAGDNSPPEKKKAYRDTLARLIYVLHHDEPYFTSAMEQNPDWIEHLLNELSKKQAKGLKDLNELSLNDPLLDGMIYHLMKEEKSLATYGTFTGKEKVSVYLASKQLLLAIFQDQHIVDEIHKERLRICKEVRRKNADMEALKNEFGLLKNAYPTSFDEYLSYDISKTNIASAK